MRIAERRGTGRVVTAATLTGLLVAGCGAAGPAAVGEWVQGRWTCASRDDSSSNTADSVVEVEDGTWSLERADGELGSLPTSTSGTWTITRGEVRVQLDPGAETVAGFTSFDGSGFPDATDEVTDGLSANGTWAGDQEPDTAELSVNLMDKAVTIDHIDYYDGTATTTDCTKE